MNLAGARAVVEDFITQFKLSSVKLFFTRTVHSSQFQFTIQFKLSSGKLGKYPRED